MTPFAAISAEPVHEGTPVHAAVTQQASEPVRTDEEIRAEESDATLLHGLGALADLLSNASETLNQCLLTLENKLSAAAVAREEWIPIQTARSAVERIPAVEERQRSQERVFGGVAVTILRMSEPVIERSAPRCEWQYELGYSVAGDDWALMIRTASSDPSNEREGCVEFSDLIPLRDAPLEIKLKAIREIPSLLQVLDGSPLGADATASDAVQIDQLEPVETTEQAETIVEQTAP
jgi:hypothetical protein